MAIKKRPRKARTPPRTRRRQAKAATSPRRPPAPAESRRVRVAPLPPDRSAESDLIVVGVGASAGGLEAFSQLLESMPPDPGIAMVLVQHLAPQYESALSTLLSSRTTLAVAQAIEGVRVERNHVYVIPPNIQMAMQDGRLHLMPRPSDRSQYNPIDYFLRSLA